MSLEGYKPLDLSSITSIDPSLFKLQAPIATDSIAAQILANTNWDMPAAQSLDANGKPIAQQHKKSFLGRVMDALSIGNYTVSDAALGALKGHQSNNSDSVLSDIGQSLAQVPLGAGKGVIASLKGTFGNDATANDPKDKKHFGDVILQATAEGRAALDPNSSMPMDERKSALLKGYLSGLPSDIVFDPLNLVGAGEIKAAAKLLGIGKAGKTAAASAEKIVADSAAATAKVSDIANVAPELISKGDLPALNKLPETPVAPINSGTPNLPEAVPNVSPVGFKNEIPQASVELPKSVSRLADPVRRKQIAGVMLSDIVKNGNLSLVKSKLATAFPGMDLTQTTRYLDRIAQNPQAIEGLKKVSVHRANFVEAINRVLEHDFTQTGRAANEAVAIPRNTARAGDIVLKSANAPSPVGAVSKISAKTDPVIVNDIINKYTRQIETGHFPGLRNPDHYAQAVASGKTVKWSGAKQVNMWQSILNRIPFSGLGKYRRALATLKAVEDHFINLGHQPYSAAKATEAIPLRLSEVIEKIGIDAIAKNPEHTTTLLRSALAGGEMGNAAQKAAMRAPGIKNAIDTAMADTRAVLPGKTVKNIDEQMSVWEKTFNNSHLAGSAKYTEALTAVKLAEQQALAKGQSLSIKLSEILEKIGPKNFAQYGKLATQIIKESLKSDEVKVTPEILKQLQRESNNIKGAAKTAEEFLNSIKSAIAEAHVANAADEAVAVKQGIDAGSTEATIANNAGNSEARVAQDINLASKTAADIAKFVGAGSENASIASQIVKQLFNKRDPLETAISRSSLNTKSALTTGRLVEFNNVQSVTNAIRHVIDSPTPLALGRTIGQGNRAVDWLGARFNAAYKNADMRPIYLAEAATARSSVAKRAAVWNKAVQQFGRDEDMWNRAMKMAQGVFHAPVGSPEQQLSSLILKNMENLVGSSGLRAGAELESSVAGRAQLLMSELNSNLIRFGIRNEFTAKKIKDSNDILRDFSQGIDWLHSWETWDIANPINFMMRMQNAVENTVREANMFNEIVSRWGVTTAANGVRSTIDHPRLAGFHFNAEHAAQIKTFMKNLEEIKTPNSKIMRQIDNVLAKWKASVTIYMPSHHIRNMIGDTYMNWLAGVNSAKPYSTAIKVMSSQKGRYDAFETLGNLTSPESVVKAIQRASTGEQAGEKGTAIALTMKNGRHITNDMIYTAAFQKGLLPGARVLEDLADDANLIERFRPLGGKGQAFFQHLAEYREHSIRLAHFVDVIKKSPKNFSGAVEDATRAVRKWHPDGMDMTTFERTVMKRMFPFYSWTRKAIPLMIESLVMAPGKVAAYPKAMGALSQGLTGGQGTSDPFPVDQLFPQWIRDKGIGPILGAAGNYTIVNPSNPTLDLASEFSSPMKGIGSMLNPALKIPAEQLTKTEMSSGAPITSQADYWTKQVPIVSTVGRLTNVGLGGPTAKGNKQGLGNSTALINLLTALGILNTGQYQTQAQYEEKAYVKNNGG